MISVMSFFQIGIIGLIEKEWLQTLASVDENDITYYDYLEVGTRLAAELRKEVSDPYPLIQVESYPK